VSLTSAAAASLESSLELNATLTAVAEAAHAGLTAASKTLPPWLFYDEAGSDLFEDITRLPEYYLTRTERGIFARHADAIFDLCESLEVDGPRWRTSVVELGAGTAAKTGVLLQALVRRQSRALYQPIDISPTALEEAELSLGDIAGLDILPCVANYVTETVCIERSEGERVLALYIGSSIGNFSPAEARGILNNLRKNLQPGDALLLGTDLAPSERKPVDALLAAYNDVTGVTAAFNRNILHRLNRELRANFRVDRYRHFAVWNAAESRIEMHLQSTCWQEVRIPGRGSIPALQVAFAPGETIHTENSYKFTSDSIANLLGDSGFEPARTFMDDAGLFAVSLAAAV
jgi:L-histidine N-alpha-methyltransferase